MTDVDQEERRKGPADGPGFLVWRVANLWQKRQRAALERLDVTPVQYLLLAGLADLGSGRAGAVTQSALAQHCRTDPMMTSQVLRTLAAAGLIERRQHRRDARAVALALTSHGKIVANKAAKAVRDADAAFFACLGAEEALFADALRLIAGERPRRRVKAGRR